MYEITIINKKKLRSLIRLVDKNFKKINDHSWEDLDNSIELITKNDNPVMQFKPKLTFQNINTSNNN